MQERLDAYSGRPAWWDSFLKRYQFRVRFGELCSDGLRRLPDGTAPVAKVQVVSWSFETAKRRAVYIARSLFKDNKMVLKAEYDIKGYRMDERT